MNDKHQQKQSGNKLDAMLALKAKFFEGLVPFLNILGKLIVSTCKWIGIAFCNALIVCAICVAPLVNTFRKTVLDQFVPKVKGAKIPLQAIIARVKSFVVRVIECFQKDGWRKILEKIWQRIKIDKRIRTAAMNYLTPLVCLLVLVQVIGSVASMHFAIAVDYDGQHVGYIDTEGTFNEARSIVNSRIIAERGEETTKAVPTFAVSLVDDSEIVKEYSLADAMIRLSSDDIVEADGLYVDDVFYGAVEDGTRLQQTLDSLLDSCRTGAEGEQVAFVNDVQVRSGLYIRKNIVDEEEMITLLHSNNEAETTYLIQEGDAPTLVAQRMNMSYSTLKSMNPDIEKNFRAGDTIKVANLKPFLSVRRTVTEHYTRSIAYETIEEKSNKYSKGYRIVKTAGVKGEAAVTANVEYVDGVEINRTILTQETIKNPVNQVVIVGQNTSYYSGSKPANASKIGSGEFMWPVNGGKISAYYGDNRGHKGMDIAAPKGTAIYASKAGTVTLAKTYYGYGKCVIINHGDGTQTLYGHASVLYVSAGQKVSKGDVIAGVGSTGQSTGNHLHFEIRINGSPVNPSRYL